MKMSPCKVHLGMFQYCLNTTKLLNSSLIETHVPLRSVQMPCETEANTHTPDLLPNRIGDMQSK